MPGEYVGFQAIAPTIPRCARKTTDFTDGTDKNPDFVSGNPFSNDDALTNRIASRGLPQFEF